MGKAGKIVVLDGSQSYDMDGEELTYQWEQISGPQVSLLNSDTSSASFTVPAGFLDGLVFSLTVTDQSGLTHTDYVSFIIIPTI